ncbi:sensor domain-containing diguanylate cyclase [Amorphus sp. 3PC139-8]|uniref:sensor domain-containing diguanylate cyclase n=1 Tax=Amorphus sp. 3PC139-8 TaxID=2735676 RepID=UPI00345DF9EB
MSASSMPNSSGSRRPWGISTGSVPIQETFCIHTLERNEVFVVEDAVHDARFADNPYVRSSPNVRFYAGAPLVTFNQVPIGTLCTIDRKPRSMTPAERQILVDLAALTINQLEVGRQALTDGLTGCWNRRMLARVFAAEERRSAGVGARFSVAALDLDYFKRLNDLYGHAAGDAVLVRFAELVRERLRPEDWLFRLGGEEFAVLISHSGSHDCAAAVDRLRGAIAEGRRLPVWRR